jgi:hypothetical protein
MAVKIGVVLAPHADELGEWLADAAAYDAAGADLLWIEVKDDDPFVLTAVLTRITYQALLVVVTDREPPDTLHRLSNNRLRLNGPHETERWVAVPAPQGRAAWREAMKQAEEHGADGVLVPAGPRLLDLLRNPEEPGERHDLELTVG